MHESPRAPIPLSMCHTLTHTHHKIYQNYDYARNKKDGGTHLVRRMLDICREKAKHMQGLVFTIPIKKAS